MAMGADHAIHITDRAFAGADTLATARTLAMALQTGEYDIILLGYHSLDAETGQVGPEVAEMMGLPQLTGVRKLEIAEKGDKVIVERELDEGAETVECALPCVVTVVEGVAPEIFPDRDAVMAARERSITEVHASDLSSDSSVFGDSGSPTWVSEIRIIESSRKQQVLEDVAPEEAARQIVAYLKDRGLLKPEARQLRRAPQPAPTSVKATQGPAVWVVVERIPSGIKPVSFELLGAAQSVADTMQGHVGALLLGGPDIGSFAQELGEYGADVVYVASDQAMAAYSTEAYTATLTAAIEAYKPYAVLLPSTVNGRDLAARVSGRLQLGLTGDAIGLEVDEEGRLVQLKPAFGGNILAPIFSKTKPNMVTIRPGLLEALGPNGDREVPVETLAAKVPESSPIRSLGIEEEKDVDVADLDNAWCILGVGMGMGGADHLAELDPLIELMGAEIICTRDVVDAGWLPRQRQVGITGRSVGPALYISIGVRGDVNHTVGVQRAGTMVAINSNRRASIFRQADIGVVAEWQAVLPALIAELKKEIE